MHLKTVFEVQTEKEGCGDEGWVIENQTIGVQR